MDDDLKRVRHSLSTKGGITDNELDRLRAALDNYFGRNEIAVSRDVGIETYIVLEYNRANRDVIPFYRGWISALKP